MSGADNQFSEIIKDLQASAQEQPVTPTPADVAKYKVLLKSLLHALIGGAAAWALAHAGDLTAGLDPLTGAIIGSVISSIASAFSKQPNK